MICLFYAHAILNIIHIPQVHQTGILAQVLCYSHWVDFIKTFQNWNRYSNICLKKKERSATEHVDGQGENALKVKSS